MEVLPCWAVVVRGDRDVGDAGARAALVPREDDLGEPVAGEVADVADAERGRRGVCEGAGRVEEPIVLLRVLEEPEVRGISSDEPTSELQALMRNPYAVCCCQENDE